MGFFFPTEFLIGKKKINILFHKPSSIENYYKSPSNTVKVQAKVSLLIFLHLDEAVI